MPLATLCRSDTCAHRAPHPPATTTTSPTRTALEKPSSVAQCSQFSSYRYGHGLQRQRENRTVSFKPL